MSCASEVKGKGLEKTINLVSCKTGEMENAINRIAYGPDEIKYKEPDLRGQTDPLKIAAIVAASKAKPQEKGGIKFPGNKSRTHGLVNILREINKIDFCNIVSYSLGKIPIVNGEPDSAFEKKFIKLQETAKKALDKMDSNLLTPSKYLDKDQLDELQTELKEFSDLIDSDIVSILPKAAVIKSNIADIATTIRQYDYADVTYANFGEKLSLLPNKEVQTLIDNIRKVRNLLEWIVAINSVGSITSKLIPKQIKDLQKLIRYSELIPIIKTIFDLAKGLNNMIQVALKFVGLLRTITRILATTIKILIKLIKVIKLIVFIITKTKVRLDIEKTLEVALSNVQQIGSLIDVIYTFFANVLAVLKEVLVELNTLIFTLETCESTKDSPLLKQLRDARGELELTQRNLTQLTSNYERAKSSATEAVFEGFIFRIEDEFLVETSVRNKRRRAVAYDFRDVLVMATDLTFATDTALLFEELKFKLAEAGYAQDTGLVIPALTGMWDGVDVPEMDNSTYTLLGLSTKDDQVSANLEAAATPNPDILSDAERARLERIVKNADETPGAQGVMLRRTEVYKTAVEKLRKDREALENG